MLKNRKKEIILALTTTCLAGLIGLFLLESYFLSSGYRSLVCEICQFHPQLGWETQPGKTISNRKLTYKTNALGMRSQEVDYKKKHILLVGDSVTFGLGVNNDETVSHYLSNKILNHQILNLGVPGYGIGQYYLNLRRHIKKLKPNLIVLNIYTTNDLEETRQDQRYGVSKPFFLYQKGSLLHLNPKISKYSCSNIYSLSRIVKHLTPKFIIDKCKRRVIKRNKASPTIAKLIDEIRVLGMKKRIPTLIVLLPALTAVERVVCTKTTIEKITKTVKPCNDLDPGFEEFYKYFSEMIKMYNLPHIDHLKNLVKYSQEKEVKFLYGNNGKDIHHFSPQGNLFLANTIADRINIDKKGKIIINKNK